MDLKSEITKLKLLIVVLHMALNQKNKVLNYLLLSRHLLQVS